MIKASDFVIAGNEFLKGEVLPFNPNVEVIPTAIDQDRYPFKDYSPPEGEGDPRMDRGSWIDSLSRKDEAHL